MINLDQSTLIAYVDGELDPLTAREVEAKLRHTPQAQKFVDSLRNVAALSRVAFHDTLHQPLPDQLLGAVAKNADTSPSPDHTSNEMHFAPPPLTPWRISLALAAVVGGVLLGLGGGFQYAQTRTQNFAQQASLTLMQDQAAMDKALNTTLEVNLSGDELAWRNPDSLRSALFTPVRTYQDKAGKYCREYRKKVTTTGQTKTTYGLACRTDQGTWKTRYLILEDANDAR